MSTPSSASSLRSAECGSGSEISARSVTTDRPICRVASGEVTGAQLTTLRRPSAACTAAPAPVVRADWAARSRSGRISGSNAVKPDVAPITSRSKLSSRVLPGPARASGWISACGVNSATIQPARSPVTGTDT